MNPLKEKSISKSLQARRKLEVNLILLGFKLVNITLGIEYVREYIVVYIGTFSSSVHSTNKSFNKAYQALNHSEILRVINKLIK